MPHAFLFAGPRGSGKTSAARILAKVINCENPIVSDEGIEPCNKCSQCTAISSGQSIDVIELDTASNRGIDDIRALRDSIALSPANAKKKVYIMDEAHMITTEAANAFLKTLEEPPSHVVFILATTDPHKLPETVLSRLTNVSFQKASGDEIKRQLMRVSKGEKIDIEDDAISLIAKKADGSFRDAVKMLESLALSGSKITKALAEKSLYASDLVNIEEFLELILSRKVKECLVSIRKYSNSGGSVRDLIDELQDVLRTRLLKAASSGEDTTEIISLIKALMEGRGNLNKSSLADLPLELAIIEWCGNTKRQDRKSADKEEVTPKKKEASKKKVAESINDDLWIKILTETRNKNVSLEALLRSARPLGLDGNTFNLAVHYRFHKERLELEQYKRLLEDILSDVVGLSPAKLVCTLEDPPEAKSEKKDFVPPAPGLTPVPAPDIIKAAEEIFGG